MRYMPLHRRSSLLRVNPAMSLSTILSADGRHRMVHTRFSVGPSRAKNSGDLRRVCCALAHTSSLRTHAHAPKHTILDTPSTFGSPCPSRGSPLSSLARAKQSSCLRFRGCLVHTTLHKCTFVASLLGKCLKHLLFQSTRLHARHELPCKAPSLALPAFPYCKQELSHCTCRFMSSLMIQLASQPPGMPLMPYNLRLYDIMLHDSCMGPQSAIAPASQACCRFWLLPQPPS